MLAKAPVGRGSGTEDRLPSLLDSMWTKYLPLMRERLTALDDASDAVTRGQLATEQREAAIDAAHKFAGSLGMFGFPEGTEAARAIEHLLLGSGPWDAAQLRSLVAKLHRVLSL